VEEAVGRYDIKVFSLISCGTPDDVLWNPGWETLVCMVDVRWIFIGEGPVIK
jgi:hypothetical protein